MLAGLLIYQRPLIALTSGVFIEKEFDSRHHGRVMMISTTPYIDLEEVASVEIAWKGKGISRDRRRGAPLDCFLLMLVPRVGARCHLSSSWQWRNNGACLWWPCWLTFYQRSIKGVTPPKLQYPFKVWIHIVFIGKGFDSSRQGRVWMIITTPSIDLQEAASSEVLVTPNFTPRKLCWRDCARRHIFKSYNAIRFTSFDTTFIFVCQTFTTRCSTWVQYLDEFIPWTFWMHWVLQFHWPLKKT